MRPFILQSKGGGKSSAALLFLLPGMFGVLGFVLFPCLDVLRRSFVTAASGEFAGLDNYREVLSNTAFLLAAANTARFAAICLPVLIGLGLVIALLLFQMPGAQLLKSIFLFPMAMPAMTVVLVWRMVFSEEGFINRLTGNETDFMNSGFSFWILVLTYLWKNLGYTVVLWLSGISQIPSETLEAAAVDGAGWAKRFRFVMLPQLKGTLYTITVLSFLNSFKVFREAYLVAGAYPHESMYLLQHLFNNWFVKLELDKMAAAAVCVAVCMFAVILVLWRLWEEKE